MNKKILIYILISLLYLVGLYAKDTMIKNQAELYRDMRG